MTNANETTPDPPTPAWWRWAARQIGGQREAARRLRVSDRAVRAWCAGHRTAPWAAGELLREKTGMYIVIVPDALDTGDPLVLENDETELPQTFDRIEEIEELKDGHMLEACAWWVFDCDSGEVTLLDA